MAAAHQGDPHATGTAMAAGFAAPLPQLVAATEPGHVRRWVLRDRKPMKQWSTGRVTLAGDAAHPTSPYAAYGAGMAIEDGYFIGRRLAGVDLRGYAAVRAALQAYEDPRKPHTARQSQQAYLLGRVFHHAPRPLRVVRDWCSTAPRSCRRWSASPHRARYSSSSPRSTPRSMPSQPRALREVA